MKKWKLIVGGITLIGGLFLTAAVFWNKMAYRVADWLREHWPMSVPHRCWVKLVNCASNIKCVFKSTITPSSSSVRETHEEEVPFKGALPPEVWAKLKLNGLVEEEVTDAVCDQLC